MAEGGSPQACHDVDESCVEGGKSKGSVVQRASSPFRVPVSGQTMSNMSRSSFRTEARPTMMKCAGVVGHARNSLERRES